MKNFLYEAFVGVSVSECNNAAKHVKDVVEFGSVALTKENRHHMNHTVKNTLCLCFISEPAFVFPHVKCVCVFLCRICESAALVATLTAPRAARNSPVRSWRSL